MWQTALQKAAMQPRSAGMGPARAPPPNERLTQSKPLLTHFRIPSPLLAGSAHKTAGQPQQHEQEDSSGSPHAAGALSGASSSGGLSSPDASEQYERGSPRRYSQELNATPESQLGGMAVSPWAPWAALRLTPSPLLLQRKGHGAAQQHASNGADVQQHATAMQHSAQHALHGLQHDVAWRGDQDRVRHIAGVKAWSPTAGMSPAAAAVSAWAPPALQAAAPSSARSLPMQAGNPAAAEAAGMATPLAAVTTTLPADLTATNPALASARHNPLFESDGLGSPGAPDTSSPLRRTPPPALSGTSHALKVFTQARQSFAFDGALAHANPTFTPSPTFGLAAAATLQRPGSPMAWHAAQRQLQMQDGHVFSHQLLAGHGQPGSETGGHAPVAAPTRTSGGSSMGIGMSGGAAAGNAPLSSAQRGSMLVEQLMQELQELEEATGV